MRLGIGGVALCIVAAELAAAACGNTTDTTNAIDASTDSSPEGALHRIDSSMGDAIGDSGLPGSDAGSDVVVSCTPLPFDGGVPAFVPPKQRQSVCTPTQIQSLFADCWMGTKAACDAFYGDPNNSTCIRCMVTDSTENSWGPIVSFPNDTSHPNVEGCVTLIDNDAGPDACGPSVQAYSVCRRNSCASICPTGSTADGLAALDQCESLAGLLDCQPFAQAADCDQGPRYNSCIFVSFQSQFIGLGEFFCAAAIDAGAADADAGGALVDGGAPVDATIDAPEQ